ncbi:MAG: trigger factor [Gammaproteobacteria bacterium]|nr:trigger factor [Gammaproteobacteria bacterium]MCF6362578.1 trigger factor [Gammaproteobacteria bacterium]
MQVSVETTTGLERRMKVAVPKDRIESEVEKRLKSLGGRAKIDGFRPGKVPFSVLRKKFGGQVRQEVLGEVLQSSFSEAIVQEKLRPAGIPHIEMEDAANDDSLEYTATFEVYPEVELKGLDSIQVERPVLEIGDADIDKMLENLRKQRKTWVGVDRPAQDGDQVTIDFEGSIDGESFAGNMGEGVELELGSGRMIAGFEEQLIGKKADDEFTLSITFPEDYQAKELAGKAADFATKVIEVEEPALPEIDDDFIAAFGVSEGGVDALRAQVRENMRREGEQTVSNRVKDQVFDGLMALELMETPRALIDAEIEVLVKQRQEAMKQYGAPVQDVDPAQFEDQAKRRVALGLILSEVIQSNDLKVPPARLRGTIEKMAGSYERPDDVIKYYYSDKSRLAEMENIALEEMAVEWVREQAAITDKPVSFDDLMNPGQTADS